MILCVHRLLRARTPIITSQKHPQESQTLDSTHLRLKKQQLKLPQPTHYQNQGIKMQ